MKKDAFCPKLSFYEKITTYQETFSIYRKKNWKNGDFLPLEAKMAQGSMSRDESVSTKGVPHPKLSFYEKDASMTMKKI